MSENLFVKANMSALAGLPISWIVNVSVLPFFAPFFATSEGAIIGASLVSIPFYITSVFRMYLIDFVYAKYNVDINPTTLFKRLLKR